MKLRLLLFEECNRKCRGCCNKSWDLAQLPNCHDFTPYDLIMLTGGEPLLRPKTIKDAVSEIRRQTASPIYLYTAKTDDLSAFIKVLEIVDGITLTLHARKDVIPFQALNAEIMKSDSLKQKSLKLNVFDGIPLRGVERSLWKVKRGIRWIENCPLPKDEVFMRYKISENFKERIAS